MNPMSRTLLVLLLWLPSLLLAAPRAWLDRDSMRLGETVTLNVETDARGGSEPDFSVLDPSFRRLGTSSNTQLSFVNGRQSARTLWAVALEPRQEGVIGIPALTVGNERTAPLSLTVLPMPTGGSAAAGDDVFLETQAEPADPYVQQQVRYTVRLYFAVQLLEGQLEEPQLQGAQVRRLGQDVQYLKTLSGRRYTVIERHYALVPEASGKIRIPGPMFRGRALTTGGYGSLMNPNANLAARGDAVELDVRGRPAQAKSPWLPAQSLRLSDESGDVATTLTVGEPLTLTLRLSAQGLAAEQLPELVPPRIEGAEVYPDQETSQTSDDGQWLHGERVRKFAIVPTRAGTLALPEVAVEWWNTQTGRADRARLAPREWSVQAAAGTGAQAPGVARAPAVATTEPAAVDATSAAPRSSGYWPWVAATFALLWLATLAWHRWRPLAARARATEAVDVSEGDVRAGVARSATRWRDALGSNDAAAVARGLVRVAQRERPTVRNLADLAQQLGDDAQHAAILRLEQTLYRQGDAAVAIAAVRDAFRSGPRWQRDAATTRERDDALPPLYPDR
jgi:hypothetical protein